MTFTSYQFFIFLPVVLVIYFLIPGKLRVGWLLLVSVVFIVHFNPRYLFPLLLSAVISYGTGLILDRMNRIAEKKEKARKKKKAILICGIIVAVGILSIYKYWDFFLENMNAVLRLWGKEEFSDSFSLILPVGISYYTFQVISYIVDIYYEKLQAERNFIYYLLYISFFPKIISGPIERADGFLGQIHACSKWRLWDWNRVSSGIILMIWGYFQKLVIADRLLIFVDEVYKNYSQYGSVELVLGAALFFIQVYADFIGYMNIAQGMARIMGFTLKDNFNAPYFAKSVREYWGRWHISLSTWLRDYIYIPLGGNRKGVIRKNINLLVTFLISGLWHGASWNFVFWGGIHGIYQVAEYCLQPVVELVNHKLHTKTESFGYQLMQVIKTLILNIVAIIFFKSATVKDACIYIKRMFIKWDPWVLFDGSLYNLGIDAKDFKVLLIALVLFFVIDWMKYKSGEQIDSWLSGQCIWFRWGFLFMLLLAVIVFGAYGSVYDAENFIYFQF